MCSETLPTNGEKGETTIDLLARPLDFTGVRQFSPKRRPFAHAAEVYGVLGGKPGYLLQFDFDLDLLCNTMGRIRQVNETDKSKGYIHTQECLDN